MALTLADTDCCIDYLRGRAPVNGALWRARRTGELAVSAVTVYELYFGAGDAERAQEVRGFLSGCRLVAVSAEAARLAAIEGARLQDLGQRLDVPDLLIAGTALELNVQLVTRNVRHFSRIEGLMLLEPA